MFCVCLCVANEGRSSPDHSMMSCTVHQLITENYNLTKHLINYRTIGVPLGTIGKYTIISHFSWDT